MKQHRYKLERYKGKKHKCPNCKQRSFSRYIDTETSDIMSEDVGRCDRADRCGYHRTPKEHFVETCQKKEHPGYTTMYASRPYRQAGKQQELQPTQPQVTAAPLIEIFMRSLQPSKPVEETAASNTFVKYLLILFPANTVAELVGYYFIGTSSRQWPGAAVFWFINIGGQVRAGQVKLFNATGHTDSYINTQDEKRKCTTWMHSVLTTSYKKEGKPIPQWLQDYISRETKADCLFGEHLLNLPENKDKTVALVEAPKTAVIASAYLPQFVWVAVGGLDWINLERCKALKGRNVCLFPDLSKDGTAFTKWEKKAKEISSLARFTLSDLLERKATEEQRAAGLDVADFLTRFDYQDFIGEVDYCNSTVVQNPIPVCTMLPTNEATSLPIAMETQQHYQSKPVKPEPLRQQPPENWTSEIDSLQAFFDNISLPSYPVKLDACTMINNVAAFIRSHIATITTNNGKPAYRPYLIRLQALQQYLQG